MKFKRKKNICNGRKRNKEKKNTLEPITERRPRDKKKATSRPSLKLEDVYLAFHA